VILRTDRDRWLFCGAGLFGVGAALGFIAGLLW